MQRPGKATPEQIQAALAVLPGWTLDGQALTRSFAFADFRQAFAFMTAVALAAEKLDHHPDWHNVYNRVEVRLSTHDAGGLTQLDFELAHLVSLAAKV